MHTLTFPSPENFDIAKLYDQKSTKK
uniref:Uncharacterized protein n=1 Tax=Rhizophora mucronata TaxID=61149 RepID=A0A2P2JXK1_RHIMU